MVEEDQELIAARHTCFVSVALGPPSGGRWDGSGCRSRERDRLVRRLEHTFEPPRAVRRIEVISAAGGRRVWSDAEKARILEETLEPGAVVSVIARRHGLTPQQVFGWRRQARHAGTHPPPLSFVPAVVEAPLPEIRAGDRIEAEIRGRPAAERRALRQERSRPVVAALEPWLREKLALVSQKSKLAEAIRYALTRFAGLTLFLEDGRVELDSNVVERAIRPLALTRKNALFAGSDRGGQHWAVIASLVETCKLNGVEPQAYRKHAA